MNPNLTNQMNEFQKLKFIAENHALSLTTNQMAEAVGEKASWVEAQISKLRKEGLIKKRKRAPKKELLNALKIDINGNSNDKSNTFPIASPISLKPKIENQKNQKKNKATEGVPDGWKRQTVVAKIERFDALEKIAVITFRKKRQVFDEAFKEYIEKRNHLVKKAEKVLCKNFE